MVNLIMFLKVKINYICEVSMKYFFGSMLALFSLMVGAQEAEKKVVEKKIEEKSPVVTATVDANSLNVRPIANTRSEVLCQLGKDDEVTVFEVKDNWARIQAPESAIVWVEAKNLRADLVRSECTIYAGPASLYTVVGKLQIGKKVKIVRGSEKWTQIVPPAGISAWVSADYLKFPEILVHGDKTEKVAKDEKKADKKDDVRDIGEKVGDLKDNKDLIASLDPGDKQYYFDKKLAAEKGFKVVTGTVTKLKKPVENLATHALVIKVDKKFYTLCYLRSTVYELDEWLNKAVSIQGKEELIAGWQRSVIEVNSMHPILGKPVLKMNEKK